MTAPAKTRRARSDAAKADRSRAILDAARSALQTEGFEALTMAGLAQRAGLAKGTLYLYFTTREEVVLAVLLEMFGDWVAGFEAAAKGQTTPQALVAAAIETAHADPLFLPLLARLPTVLETNLSDAVLIATKRQVWANLDRVTQATARGLGLDAARARPLGLALATAFQGAAASDLAGSVARGPMPADVEVIFAATGFDACFGATALLILKGALAD